MANAAMTVRRNGSLSWIAAIAGMIMRLDTRRTPTSRGRNDHGEADKDRKEDLKGCHRYPVDPGKISIKGNRDPFLPEQAHHNKDNHPEPCGKVHVVVVDAKNRPEQVGQEICRS